MIALSKPKVEIRRVGVRERITVRVRNRGMEMKVWRQSRMIKMHGEN